jgi:tight adherence protein B
MVVIMGPIAVKFPFITGLSLLAAMTIGGAWFGDRIYVRQREKQRFTAQLIEAIDILIRGARVGISMQESFQIIAREMPSPIGVEFKTLAEKMSIGIDLETALKEASLHRGIKEFQFLATTLILQRQSGGQYAEVLENLNRVLRDRQAQLMKARAVTSEARLSAKIIAGVTVIILCILALTNRQQFYFLLNDPSGHSILGYGFVSTLFGFFLISRILRTMK